MKKCRKCGAMVSDNVKFCPYCGTSFSQAEQDASEDNHRENVGATEYHVEKIRPRKKHKRKWVAILGVFIVVIIAGIFAAVKKNGGNFEGAFSFGKPSINLEDYIEIKFSGYDGSGTIDDGYPRINEEALQRKMDAVAENHHGSASEIASDIQLELTKGGDLIDGKNLDNEEILTVRLDYDSQELKDICPEIHFFGSERNETVKLKVLVSIDPFENYKPVVEGISPAGYIRLDLDPLGSAETSFVSECYSTYSTLPFDFYLDGRLVESDTFVAVGDTIEMRLNDNGRATLEDNGYTCLEENKKKTYKLTLADFDEGEYVLDEDEVDSNVESELMNRLNEKATAFAAENNFQSTPEFIGNCISTAKDGVDMTDYPPYTSAVYEVDDNDTDSEGEEEKRYIIVYGPVIIEQVENHGKEDVTDNPGDTIQNFNKDDEAFSARMVDSSAEVKRKFASDVDTYNHSLSKNLKIFLNGQ